MSNRPAAAILGAVALGLSAVIGLELRAESGVAEAPAAPRPAMAAGPAAAMPVSVDHSDDWVAKILARPLFSTSRRPPAPGTTIATTSAPARLSGILVSARDRLAIFAASGEGKPIVAHVGSQVGEDVVQSIEPERVTMRGPDGDKVLRPSYESKAADALSGSVEQPRAPGLRQRKGGSEAREQAADLGR